MFSYEHRMLPEREPVNLLDISQRELSEVLRPYSHLKSLLIFEELSPGLCITQRSCRLV